MAKIRGRVGSLGLEDSSAACQALTKFLNQITLTWSAEVPDVTSFTDVNRERLNDGIQDYELTFAGFFANGANEVDDVLSGIGPGGSTRFAFGPNGSTSACIMYSGCAVLQDYAVEYSVEGAGTVSGTLVARSGSLTKGNFG